MKPMSPSSPTTASASDLQRRKADGRAHLNANRISEALAVFTRILQEHPDDLETHLWLGNCYLARHDTAAARQCYARARTLDPQNPAMLRFQRLAQTRLFSSAALRPAKSDTATPPEAPAVELVSPAIAANYPNISRRSNARTQPLPPAVLMESPGPQRGAAAYPPTQAHYLLGLEVFFNARHFVTVNGKAGPIHAHSFRVTVRIRHAAIQPGHEYVLGFGIARELVQSETNQLNDTLLNNLEPYRSDPRLQPTTESLAATIFQRLQEKIPAHLQLESVTVWESPTNSVTYQEVHL